LDLAIQILQWPGLWVLAPVSIFILACLLIKPVRAKETKEEDKPSSAPRQSPKTGLNRSQHTPTKQQRP